MQINLGCPYKCDGWTCIDLSPLDSGVFKGDLYQYLNQRDKEFADKIRAKNLLEHLTDLGLFFKLCNRALKDGGELEIITDNAEFIPFYIPIFYHLGWGAHSSNKYRSSMNGSKHYCIFTKLHLRNLLSDHGFRVIKINRMLRYGFARIHATAIKYSPKKQIGECE